MRSKSKNGDRPFYGWRIVAGCCFLQACCLGLMMNSAGIFYTPVTEDLGIGLGPLAMYVTVYFFVTTFVYPFVARILPKYNINVVLTIAALICCLGLGLMSTYTSVWQWYFSGVLYGIGGAFVFVVAATVLIQNWFDKRRGLALGITQCFSGVGGAIFPIVGTLIMDQVGWRLTYLILAIIAAVLVLPWTMFVFKFKPEDVGQKPYGYEEKKTEEGAVVAVYRGVPARKAIVTVAFWALFFYGGVEELMAGYNTHLPGFAVSIGFDDIFGSTILSLAQVGYVFATIFIGWLTDHIGVARSSYLTLAITALSLLGFALLRDQIPLLICAFFFGTNSVIVTISISTLVSDIFGRRDYTKIISYLRMSGCVAAFGSSAIGFVYDATGRFDISFYAGIVILAICAFLVWLALSQKDKIHAKYWIDEDSPSQDGVSANNDKQIVGAGAVEGTGESNDIENTGKPPALEDSSEQEAYRANLDMMTREDEKQERERLSESMFDYQEFLDSIDREVYHEGEWRWEEDGYTVTRTYHYSPPGCHSSCGLLFYVKDGKVERVEGDPLDPCTNGKLCIKCLTLDESLNHPDRLRYPMKRAGERGENKWERITWDEAYDEIEEHVKSIWETDGGNAIICVHGTGRNINWQVPFFGQCALKTPNISTFGFTGFSCYMPRICGSIAPFGDFPIVDASEAHEDRYNNSEWVPPEVLVVWGNEPLASNADGYIGHWLVVCVQMGTKIISIDPRLTWWGARAEYHLQLRPGTDAALACAWLNVVISEGLYDPDFIASWCSGFDELAASVSETTPEWAAEICSLDAEDIRGSARLYAQANPGAIQWGLAFDQQRSAMALCLAGCDLMAICGNVDVPGGNILVHNAFEINAGYASGEEHTPAEWRAKKLNNSFALGIEGGDFIAHASSDGLLQAIEDDFPYPIKMMWIQSSNTLSCPSQDSPRVLHAMKRIPYIVNADPYLTPTSVALADMILPVAMSAERDSARTWWTPCRAMVKVTSFYEARSDEEIILDLGHRLNPEIFGRWETVEDWLNWYLHDGTGSFSATTEATDQGGAVNSGKTLFEPSWRELVEDPSMVGHSYDAFNATYHKAEKGMYRPDGSIGYGTPSGRLELAPVLYSYWGLSTTPFHVEPPEGPITTPELMKEYPLILTCGGRSYEFFHSEHRQLPTMRELHPQPRLLINPKTAERYGVQDGQWVWIENDHGRFKQQAKVSEVVNEVTVHAEHGWWFPETEPAEPFLFGTFESNPNNCTQAFTTGQGGVGAPIKAMICKVYPVADGDIMPYEEIAEHGNFPQYKKICSPRQDEINRYHEALAEGLDYDVMTNQIIDPTSGARTDLKTGEPATEEAVSADA